MLLLTVALHLRGVLLVVTLVVLLQKELNGRNLKRRD
jgi:hypothetical protein